MIILITKNRTIMQNLFFLISTIVCLISCKGQSNVSQESATPVETILQSACLLGIQDDDEICNKIQKLDLESTSKTLLAIKKPKLPRPCMEGANCKVDLKELAYLRSYLIEKIASFQIIDAKGTIINEAKDIVNAQLDELPYATYINLEKPLENKGTMVITGFSKNLGGDFKIVIDLGKFN